MVVEAHLRREDLLRLGLAAQDLLFSVVYTMLGTVADTEDVLQETWLSWTSRALAPAAEPVDQPRAYLVRIAINQAIARRAADSRRRQTYVGQWLPEPLLTPHTGADAGAPEDGAEAAVRAESFSVTLLVLLETPSLSA